MAFEQLDRGEREPQEADRGPQGVAGTSGSAAPARGPDPRPAEPETIVVTTGAEASSAVVRLVDAVDRAGRAAGRRGHRRSQPRSATTPTVGPGGRPGTPRHERTGSRPRPRRPPTGCRPRPRSRADNLDSEIAGRRSELLDGLNAERDELQVAVGQLRGFEASFRANLADELPAAHQPQWSRAPPQPYEVPALAEPSAVAEAEQRSADTGDAAADGGRGTAGAGDAGDAPTTPPTLDLGAASRCSRTTTRPTMRTPTGPARRLGWTRCWATSADAVRTTSRPVDLGRAVRCSRDEPPAIAGPTERNSGKNPPGSLKNVVQALWFVRRTQQRGQPTLLHRGDTP